MVTVKKLYSDLKLLLSDGSIEDYTFEAGCLAERFCGITRSDLIANPDKPVPDTAYSETVKAAEKRITGYPLQYILGTWEFFGLPFRVGDGVLIPRQDTETLVESVLNQFANSDNLHIADLCSGSGCIPVALEKHLNNPDISAVEYSDKALKYLKQNTELNNSSVKVYCLDVLSSESCSSFANLDIITSNPPYLTDEDMAVLQKEVSFEPEMALLGGNDGLLFYRTITKLWKTCLKPGGMLFYETGIGQENDVSEILVSNGFTDIKIYPDLCGINRVVSGVYNY